MQKLTDSRILVVDDEPPNIEILTRVLTRAGYTNVVSTMDPREVESLWESFSPDLLLLDLMMPHMDGFAVMESLGAREWPAEGKYLPILVLTADISRSTRNRALSAGAKDFLTKPFDHDEVRLRIANLLETRALHLMLERNAALLEQRVAERTKELRASLQELHVVHAELRSSREETVRRLSMAAELRDDDTGRHIVRMSRYAGLLAAASGIDEERSALIEMATQMHDVGKIGIPDSILLKPGKLTAEERVVMERHAAIGYDLLSGSSSELLSVAASIALTHHERVDGTGYPYGLKGEAIPLEGRIAAVADVFDALTSDRVYRPAMPVEKALDIMREGRGTHFDPELLDTFFGSIEEVKGARTLIEMSWAAA